MSATHAARLPRPAALLAVTLAIGAAIAVWMRPKKAGYEPPLAPERFAVAGRIDT